ncbi:MAG: GNAT family N-acetyltransferase [Cognatishimia sp.]|uniref:GNAT family N-acetyltransferase n=1 Tax=Cognatishimia sp. TaxID=2211648 RepID=UPI003B8DC15F
MTGSAAYPWTLPVQNQPAALAASLRALVPVIKTERLILRAPELLDFAAYETIMAADVHGYMGGPFNTEDAWLDFNQGLAGWSLRGQGMWTVTLADETVVGFVCAMSGWGDQETELGYLFLADHHGRGFATEACRAARDYAWDTQGETSMVSYIDPKNLTSRKLAERLGAQVDANAPMPDDASSEDTIVLRHLSGRRS